MDPSHFAKFGLNCINNIIFLNFQVIILEIKLWYFLTFFTRIVDLFHVEHFASGA